MKDFRKIVSKYWREHGRHNLAWRKTKDPYKVLVSEVMLQQTQVERVITHYKRFLKAFPTIQALARAPLATVLRVWSGLGYNRRARFLRDASQVIADMHGGKFPRSYKRLRALPGVGDYTAKAVRVFVFNEPEILIETNIRTVLFHHFANIGKCDIHILDREVLEIAKKAAEGQDPKTWHWALMDYGAYLKKTGARLNHKSAHYTKQSKFEGSLRQLRGAILKAFADGESIRDVRLRYKEVRHPYIGKFGAALAALERDGLISKWKGKWRIS